MCGIAGILDLRTPPADREEAVRRMCGTMVHRGPDDGGCVSLGRATLGMRRLAVFDPANGGQPMQSPDRRFTLVFNGAIYNFRALRAELAGHWEFRTQCDTEVLLASVARWGADCLQRLRGMYAFAVWDERDQSLLLARDPFGIKPLYVHHAGARLVFASEIKALLASGRCPADLDPAAVGDYLAWLSVPAPRTIYRDVFALRPGEVAEFRSETLHSRASWSFATIPAATACRSRDDFLGELRSRLEDSVRAHQVADVPVGAFLSGGLDSAAVVGLMSAAGGPPLRTFSIAFEEPGYSEAGGAASTARHFGARHETSVLRGADLARDLPSILAALDQPTGDGLNTYYASRAARRGGVTVALSGLGGDELFGGYPSFRDVPRLARWLPAWHRLPAAWRNLAMRRLGTGTTRQRKLADFLRHARTVHELGALQRRVFPETDCHALLHGDARVSPGTAPFHPETERLSAELAGSSAFDTISAWELRTYMADVLLRDSDVMSMQHSLELRVPLIDRPLVEWLWRQPATFKADRQRTKPALADALADILPPHVRSARKHGFTLPMVIWMKRELRPFLDETFSDASVGRSGMFAVPAVQQLWRDFVSGNDSRRWSRVWSLAVLIAFINRGATASARVASAPAINASTKAPFPPTASVRPAAVERPHMIAPATRLPAVNGAAPARTLFLAPEIFASEGGIPRILQMYLRALCELAEPRGTVGLLALNDAQIAAADLRRHANNRLAESAGCSRRKTRFVRAALRMSRGCDRVVCGHVFLLPVAWLARRLNPRIRYYLVAHGIEVWRPFTLKERVALRGAEKIFCVSEHTERELRRHCPLPANRTAILHNALDPFFALERGQPLRGCPPVILTVTRLTYADRYKGVQHLIEAMPAIRSAVPGARLRVIGRGDDLQRLEGIRDSLGLRDAVEFTGYVDDQRLAEEMRSCRLFALPSRKEGFGLVFLEAMAKGRPCVGARAGGIPEVITPDTGRLVEYGDLPALAGACAESLRFDWDEQAILARARAFSYPAFRARLGNLLAA